MIRAQPLPPDPAMLLAAKAFLRVEVADEDALIARLCATAVAHGEAFTGQLFVARAVTEVVPVSAGWTGLAARPVAAITAVAAQAPMGVAVPLAPDAYLLDIDGEGTGWVRVLDPRGATRLAVTCTAGLAAGWAQLPEALAQGAIRLAAHLFTNRDAGDEGALPPVVHTLWRPWRRSRLS